MSNRYLSLCRNHSGGSIFLQRCHFWNFEEKLFILFSLTSLLENAAEWRSNSGKSFPAKLLCSLWSCVCGTDTFLKVNLNLWSTVWSNRKYGSKKISLYFALWCMGFVFSEFYLFYLFEVLNEINQTQSIFANTGIRLEQWAVKYRVLEWLLQE